MTAAEPLMTPERMEQGRRYRRIGYRLQFSRTVLSALFSLVLVLGGANLLWEALPGRLAFVAAFLAIGTVVQLPLDYYSYRLARRYGISVQGPGGWLMDELKGFLLSLLLMGSLLYGVLALWETRPESWHLWMGGFTLAGMFLITFASPVLIAPLFHKYRPLGEGELNDRLMALSRRAGVFVKRCVVMEASKKSTGLNASLSGLGQTRRITLFDTMIAACTVDEVEVVLAHEMGHHIHNHILKFTAMGAAAIVALFGLGGLYLAPLSEALGLGGLTPAALPLGLLLVSVLGLLLRPAMMAYSRQAERDCDTFALKLTNNPDAFITAFRKLADKNLADFDPPRWAYYLYFSHPPVPERVAMAEAHRAGRL